jgi:hypothetical protein
MLQQPKPRALLFAIISHLPEIEHIALDYDDEIAEAWNPITDDWLPGVYWLSGDVFRGQNLVLTQERADRMVHAIDVIERHSSRTLKRDLRTTKAYVRAHTGRTLQEMRSELFDDGPPATSGPRVLWR